LNLKENQIIIAATIGVILVAGALTLPLAFSMTEAKDSSCSNAKVCKITGKNIKLEDIDHLTIQFPTSSGQAFNDSALKQKDQALQNSIDLISAQLQNLSNSAITSLDISPISSGNESGSGGGGGNESSGAGAAGGNTNETGNATSPETGTGNSTNSTG
jgi:hypothetical protein